MQKIKKILNHIFIEGLSGMAMGLFATLIIGTIICQIASLIGGTVGNYLNMIGTVAKIITGAGIGVGVAGKFKSSPLVTVSAATAGMVGSFAAKIISGAILVDGTMMLSGVGEPMGAFIAAMVAIDLGNLVSGKTKVDIIVTPFVSIISGSIVGLLAGPPISSFMTWLGELVNWGTEQQPFLMGIIVSVLMGMILTLPISSAAIGVSMGLSGIAAGAACAGCSANMVGFAVASYRENKMGGLIAQGVGTSMLQVPNIMKKPVIWLPAIIASAITGPISSWLLKMTCNATGSGMGTSGLVGQIMTFNTMTAEGVNGWLVLGEILLVQVILPGVIAFVVSEIMRKYKVIKEGDMKLEV
ncbi:MAG: PTS sugar transporter subunit IIC [Lachnospiraceae bacterium]|nr:PTS sugar transporter subunit IIC [Lachnospiraceae bacterium]